MKRFLLILLAAMIGLAGNAMSGNKSDDTPKKPIRIVKDLPTQPIRRDLFPDAQAYILPSQKLIELQLFELGPTTVYVFDSFGRIIYQEEVDGDNNFVTFGTPETGGNYTLVIWSPYFYGEGTFSIR